MVIPTSLVAFGTGLTLALSATASAAPPPGSCVTPLTGPAVPDVRCVGPSTPAPIEPISGGTRQRAPEPQPMPYPLPAHPQLEPELY
jgi:hypothetical protein